MNIIQLNEKIDTFVNQYGLSDDALALKQEHAIQKSDEWQAILDGFSKDGRVLRIGIIGRVKAGKSSMLNALVFEGRDILPKAATPMTAALTTIEYSETVRAEVDFFTQSDIDEIKKKHDIYCEKLEQKVHDKKAGLIERLKKKKAGFLNYSCSSEEERDCQKKAESQAEREMKSDPTFASYDQYRRIEASGKSLSDLQQYKTIQANSVEDLMTGKLNQFVSSGGDFMPFTKAVTLYIPEKGLQGLQLIDTPGINDPVTSRGERTEQLLQECDVVLIVSPSGQFLSSEDTNLIHRITTKEGTQQVYIIASQVDSQLFGNERAGFSSPLDVLDNITATLSNQARNVLNAQAASFPEMKILADKLNKNDVICSSSVAFSILKYFDTPAAWDANSKHVFDNLNYHYPDTFKHPELAKNALKKLANIEKLHQIITDVTTHKAHILTQRRTDFENSKRAALRSYLKALSALINERIHQIETMDINSLREQQMRLAKQQALITHHVSDVYDDLVSDIQLNLSKELKDELNRQMREYEEVSEGAQGTTTESKQVSIGRSWRSLWLTEEYETRQYNVQTVQATSVRRAIERIRAQLEDNLTSLSGKDAKIWREKAYRQIVSAVETAMRQAGGDQLDLTVIFRAVRNVVACMPEVSFKLKDDIPSSLKKSGQLKDTEAQNYLHEAENYVSRLRTTVRNDISNYINEWVGRLKKNDLPNTLTGQMNNYLSQLLNEIENKEASLFRYRNIQKELSALEQEVA